MYLVWLDFGYVWLWLDFGFGYVFNELLPEKPKFIISRPLNKGRINFRFYERLMHC